MGNWMGEYGEREVDEAEGENGLGTDKLQTGLQDR